MSWFKAPLIPTYAPPPIHFVKGEGCWLEDDTGKKYLDCLAGIAVVSAGHCNQQINTAVLEQLNTLGHLSNLFWTEPMAKLAKKLREITGFGKVFFANSGAEANECAVKLARKWATEKYGENSGKYKMLCADLSFHGRTLGTLQATGQPAKWQGFAPLGDANIHLPFNDLDAFKAAIDESLIAIWVEPIQGEGGVVPGEQAFLEGLRELCNEHGLLLIFDEVQSGIGRTGAWWAFQNYGVEPDIFTSAKALGNGLPIGACIAKDEIAAAFEKGDHASTFGGGPVVCASALATISFLDQEKILESIPGKESFFVSELEGKAGISGVRGKGLMLACLLEKENAGEVASLCLEKGLIVNGVRPSAIRITPPLTISHEEIHQACEILSQAIEELG